MIISKTLLLVNYNYIKNSQYFSWFKTNQSEIDTSNYSTLCSDQVKYEICNSCPLCNCNNEVKNIINLIILITLIYLTKLYYQDNTTLWGKYELGILNREHDHPDNKQNDHYLTYLNWLNENARDNKYQIYYNTAIL